MTIPKAKFAGLALIAAETVHLKIVDHLIVTPDRTFSFRKAGLL